MAVVGIPLVTLYIPGRHIVIHDQLRNGLQGRLCGGRLRVCLNQFPACDTTCPRPFTIPGR